jgi:chromosome segregation ATPase
MVRSFFRRNEDSAKGGFAMPRNESVFAPVSTLATESVAAPFVAPDVSDYEAFGSALEENQQSSHELMASLASIQERVSSLLGAHSRSLDEVGALRSECARVTSLLDYEGSARRKFEQDSVRLATENKGMRADNAQLLIEIEAVHDELVKLQALHEVKSKEFTIVETRLLDVERELAEQAGQYDQATTLLKRTQQELDLRSREFAAARNKLDQETTAHQLLMETTRRENGIHTRELARLNEEISHLRSSLAQQEALVRNLQSSASGLKQELSIFEERHRRLEEEFENLQASSALEIAQLNTKQEAVGSKAELVEKLLLTANGRNKMTDEELQTARAELKRVRSDLATASSRAERFESELTRVRSTAAESEAARRDLAAQCNELTIRLKESEGLRSRRDRETETLRRDMDLRAETDRHDVDQLRTSLEIAKAEIRQLRAERAIMAGQLEVARGERASILVNDPSSQEHGEPLPLAHQIQAQPLIDISERSLRSHGTTFGVRTGKDDLTFDSADELTRLPPAE